MPSPATDDDLSLLARRIRVARGLEPGDTVLVGGQVVNVFTRETLPANVVIADGRIAGVGPFEWQAREQIDVTGRFILPGLIDAHMHLESTLLSPGEFARLVVPHGTAAVVADPHEVGNVLGVPGIEMLLEASRGLPLDFYFMAPSCVPCCEWEHAGATLHAAEIDQLLAHDRVLGLAEVMDFPAVLAGRSMVLDKVLAAKRRHAAVDGHAPGLSGKDLVAYVAAGIRSDHESTTIEEARAKARLGMLVQVREGSIARNLDSLMPLLVADQLGDWALCTDDIHPDHLRAHGHIDYLLRRVVAAGVPAEQAVRHVTLVPARHYGLADRGAIAPGFRADLAVVGDLRQFKVELVLHGGELVARDGRSLAEIPPSTISRANTVHLARLEERQFEYRPAQDRCPAIELIADEILTRRVEVTIRRESGRWVFDPAQDVALVASLERHRASGQIGLGLAKGFGFHRDGAIGSSVAHDSHNVIVAGTNARDMKVCAEALAASGGGFVAVAQGRVLSLLPLPVAGLLSTASANDVCEQLSAVRTAARELGCRASCPFGALSFLALSVIPELRITDQGLFDVVAQQFVSS